MCLPCHLLHSTLPWYWMRVTPVKVWVDSVAPFWSDQIYQSIILSRPCEILNLGICFDHGNINQAKRRRGSSDGAVMYEERCPIAPWREGLSRWLCTSFVATRGGSNKKHTMDKHYTTAQLPGLYCSFQSSSKPHKVQNQSKSKDVPSVLPNPLSRFDKTLMLILCQNSLANHPCRIASSRSVQSVLQVRLEFLDTLMSLTKPARQAPVSDWKHEVKIGHCPVRCLPCAAPWLMNLKDAPNSSKDQQIAQIQDGCLLSLGIWKSMIQTEELTEISVLGDFPWTKAIPNRSKWAFDFNFRVRGSFEHHKNQTANGYQNELCEWLCILILMWILYVVWLICW